MRPWLENHLQWGYSVSWDLHVLLGVSLCEDSSFHESLREQSAASLATQPVYNKLNNADVYVNDMDTQYDDVWYSNSKKLQNTQS